MHLKLLRVLSQYLEFFYLKQLRYLLVNALISQIIEMNGERAMNHIDDGVHDISNEAYHGSLGISRSALMEFKKSPYHYWYKYINPSSKSGFCTPAMLLGELVHALVLEPEYFNDRYIFPQELEIMPAEIRLKDVGKEQFEQFKENKKAVQDRNNAKREEFRILAEGKKIISLSMYQEAAHYASSALKDDVAKALFTGVDVEKSIYFTHKGTGIQCKVRPDAWIGGVVTDLKTCKDASFDAFQRSAISAGYFIQAAMIKQALESIGIELQKFIFYCVEKSEAAPCTYYQLDADTLTRAENEFNGLMQGIEYCMKLNRWGAYQPQILTYPAWAKL